MKREWNVNNYRSLARAAAAEGCVLVRNENDALPLDDGMRVAVFGRAQAAYYKSGTGSGGMVNTAPVASILEVLEQESGLTVDAGVKSVYEAWIAVHPFQQGSGWASEPWFQEEMPLDPQLAQQAAARCGCAVVVIGRTAGEDQDNTAQEGSYFLTRTERDMLSTVCSAFSRTIVLLNVGNIIDMQWVEQLCPTAVVYLWQGGEMGAYAAADILTGRVNPSGKLSDTIARRIEDYPAIDNYGDAQRTEYCEDIYIGYRYFETFAPEKVLYPFGFGLSYSTFSIQILQLDVQDDMISVQTAVTNTGHTAGKEVVQVYCAAPQGKLGKAARSLCAFAKTPLLQPGQRIELTLRFSSYVFASYDDSGVSGMKDAYVLEAGAYRFYVGTDVHSASFAGEIRIDTYRVLRTHTAALEPVRPFRRIHPVKTECGYRIAHTDVPTRSYDLSARISGNLPEEIAYTGDRGIRLADVAEKRAELDAFIAQLDREALCCLVRGEGMCSPRVTPGTAGAFGGVTDALCALGIPTACCADGPGGIRMDCGTHALALPVGTCIACTFNTELTQKLFAFLGLELRKNRIDTILGPGMNLHRCVLNGRNFEYFSEDPLLTGKMASAQLHGLHECGVTGTIKHFACNNQEYKRNDVDAVVSQRALREMYLKGFEIAVQEGGAYCIMSSYNLINGIHTASSYDLLTSILRGEWGYTGLVMTDWWAKGNFEGEPDSGACMSAQIRAQNDLYMVARDAKMNSNGDDSESMLAAGRVTLAEYQRSAANICRNLIRLPAFAHLCGKSDEIDELFEKAGMQEEDIQTPVHADAQTGAAKLACGALADGKAGDVLFEITAGMPGSWSLFLRMRGKVGQALAQAAVSIFYNRTLLHTISLSGSSGQSQEFTLPLGPVRDPAFYIRVHSTGGMEIEQAVVRRDSGEAGIQA